MINNPIKKQSLKFKRDVNISIAILVQFLILIIQLLVVHSFEKVGMDVESIISILSKGITALFIILVIPIVFRRTMSFLIKTLLFVLFVLLFNFIVFPGNLQGLKSILFSFLFISIPMFIYSYSLTDFRAFNKVIIGIAYIVFVVGLVIFILLSTKVLSFGTYDMSYSYYMVLPGLVSMYCIANKKYILLNIVVLFVSTMSILLYGSRGAILCLGAYFVFLLFSGKKIIRKIILITLVAILFSIIVVYYNEIILKLIYFFDKHGISSRTLNYLLENNISEMSSRERIYNRAITYIEENPLLGTGLASDRLLFLDLESTTIVTYVHNIFLEMIMDFGVVFGLLAIIVFVSLLVIAFIKCSDKKMFFLIFSIGFIPLIFSFSYLAYSWFWILFGLSMNICFKKKDNIGELNGVS